MLLRDIFETDDGSLPEIKVLFESSDNAVEMIAYLFSLGAVDVTRGGSWMWLVDEDRSVKFSSPDDVKFVMTYKVEPFHIVLSSIKKDGVELPELGVFIFQESLVLDYRMGSAWTNEVIEALFSLLRDLRSMGGKKISIRQWWGDDAQTELETILGDV